MFFVQTYFSSSNKADAQTPLRRNNESTPNTSRELVPISQKSHECCGTAWLPFCVYLDSANFASIHFTHTTTSSRSVALAYRRRHGTDTRPMGFFYGREPGTKSQRMSTPLHVLRVYFTRDSTSTIPGQHQRRENLYPRNYSSASSDVVWPGHLNPMEPSALHAQMLRKRQ